LNIYIAPLPENYSRLKRAVRKKQGSIKNTKFRRRSFQVEGPTTEKAQWRNGNREKKKTLFIYSFIPDISISPHHIHYYSEALPITALIL